MATIYRANDNNVFESDLLIERFGRRYVIDATDIAKIKAYPLKEVAMLGDEVEFLSNFYPNYEISDEISCIDDLECLLHNECDSDKLSRLTVAWGSDPDTWQLELDVLRRDVLNTAIENYKKQL